MRFTTVVALSGASGALGLQFANSTGPANMPGTGMMPMGTGSSMPMGTGTMPMGTGSSPSPTPGNPDDMNSQGPEDSPTPGSPDSTPTPSGPDDMNSQDGSSSPTGGASSTPTDGSSGNPSGSPTAGGSGSPTSPNGSGNSPTSSPGPASAPKNIGDFQKYGCVSSSAGFPTFKNVASSKSMTLDLCAASCPSRFFGVNEE